MKIFGHPLSSCTRKVLVLLAEKQSRADFVLVDLMKGEHKQPAHLARHPMGVIPVVEDDGVTVFESRAILRYLDARIPGVKLTPETLAGKAAMDEWLSIDQSYVAPHIQEFVRQKIIMPAMGQKPSEQAINGAREGLTKAFAAIESRLAGRDYLAGESFSLADISLMPYVGALPHFGETALVERSPALSGWWRRMESRPSWRTTAPS